MNTLKTLTHLTAVGRDELLHAPMLEQWARSHTDARVMVAPRLRHADVLLHGRVQDNLVTEIVNMAYGEGGLR